LRQVVTGFFGKMKGKFSEITGSIKDRIAAFIDPAGLLKKITNNAVEWVFSFFITNSPSPLFNLLAKAVERIAGKPVIDILREKVKFADKIINKIADSGPVQKIVSPLRGPVTRITGIVDTVVGKAGSFVDNMETRILSLLSSGANFLKQLTGGHKAPAAEAGSKAGEEKQADAAKAGDAKQGDSAKADDGDFLGTVESGIHTRLVTIGSQLLVDKAKATGKSLLEKGKEKIKGILLGKKLGFNVKEEHHELWAEQQGSEIIVFLASKERPIEDIISMFERAVQGVHVSEKRGNIDSLIEQLKKTNSAIKAAGKRKSTNELEDKQRTLKSIIERLLFTSHISLNQADGDTTKDRRNQPGRAEGGVTLSNVAGKWMWKNKHGPFPLQIAKIMRGTLFKSFDEFRETFWRLVSIDKDLKKGWKKVNRDRIGKGLAPFAVEKEKAGEGSNAKIQINHIDAIRNNGKVYDLDILEVVSHKMHQVIDPPGNKEE
jgi:hypothetical protein